ncbi:MAG: ThuA domain-containing protein [Polyangiaceae bacterium]
MSKATGTASRMSRVGLAALIALALVLGACTSASITSPAQKPARVLLYQRETFWFHPSTNVAGQALRKACEGRGLEVEVSKDPGLFEPANLSRFDAVVFLLSSGPTLNARQRQSFHRWVADHHGVVGVHSAAFTDADDPFMGAMFGASFFGHPPRMITATQNVEDPTHRITKGLPRRYVRTDEWYTFDRRPELTPGVHVLLTLDESSAGTDYPGEGAQPGLLVGYHPTTWTIERASSRVFYTGMGHTVESWSEPAFVDLVAEGVVWATEARLRSGR